MNMKVRMVNNVPPLEGGQRQGVADEAAEGLDLGGDHGDDLALGGAAEVGQGEAQRAAVEQVAQPAQHPFAELPLEDVDHVLEGAVDQHQGKKDRAQDEQVFDLVEPDVEDGLGEILRPDGIVDDDLGKLEAGVEEGERDEGQEQQDDLPTPGVAEDVFEDGRFHRLACPCAPAASHGYSW